MPQIPRVNQSSIGQHQIAGRVLHGEIFINIKIDFLSGMSKKVEKVDCSGVTFKRSLYRVPQHLTRSHLA